MLFGITAVLISIAAYAATPTSGGAPVTVQNVPLPVSLTGGVQTIKEAFVYQANPVQPPGGVPSWVTPVIFRNNSETTALVYAYVSHKINQPYVCDGGIRPTAVDVNIWPIDTMAGRTIQLPMKEYLSVRREGVSYCWAEMSDGPFFIPPGFEMRFNIVYSEIPPTLIGLNVNVNGYYMK
jgi:hypothetical protein